MWSRYCQLRVAEPWRASTYTQPGYSEGRSPNPVLNFSGDEVPFPMALHGAVLDLGRALGDSCLIGVNADSQVRPVEAQPWPSERNGHPVGPECQDEAFKSE
jgi:hypothetical protein